MLNYTSFTFVFLASAVSTVAGDQKGDNASEKPSYALSHPQTEPVIFGKGIISGEEFDSHPAFTPDGRTLYFVRSTPNFDFWTIFVSHFESGKWSKPQVAPFSGKYSEADPFITADGRRFYFISKRPVNSQERKDTNIWMMENTEGGWSEPRYVDAPINSEGFEWYPTVTREGTIYFGSDRPGGHGQTDLYRARLVDGKYVVENLGEPVSTAADEYEPFIAPNETFLIFMAAGRPDSLGKGDLYISYRSREKWAPPKNLGNRINSGGMEYSPAVTPDGKYFFWTSTRGGNWKGRPDAVNKSEKSGEGLGDIYQVDFSQVVLRMRAKTKGP